MGSSAYKLVGCPTETVQKRPKDVIAEDKSTPKNIAVCFKSSPKTFYRHKKYTILATQNSFRQRIHPENIEADFKNRLQYSCGSISESCYIIVRSQNESPLPREFIIISTYCPGLIFYLTKAPLHAPIV